MQPCTSSPVSRAALIASSPSTGPMLGGCAAGARPRAPGSRTCRGPAPWRSLLTRPLVPQCSISRAWCVTACFPVGATPSDVCWNVTERAQLPLTQLCRIRGEYAANMTHVRGNRALVIGHRLVTHAAERAGIDPHHLTSSGASAQLRWPVAALASTGEHSSPLSLNQRVGGSIPSRRTVCAGQSFVA
jgi:hypothetical protein